jgi:hypothetical protein
MLTFNIKTLAGLGLNPFALKQRGFMEQGWVVQL